MACNIALCSGLHSSSSTDRTRDTWAPKFLCIPEHSMHISIPRLSEAHTGFGMWQSSFQVTKLSSTLYGQFRGSTDQCRSVRGSRVVSWVTFPAHDLLPGLSKFGCDPVEVIERDSMLSAKEPIESEFLIIRSIHSTHSSLWSAESQLNIQWSPVTEDTTKNTN